MSQTILAAVSLPGLKTEVQEFAMPVIAEDAGMLKVELSGVCGSDWPHYNNYPKSKGPLILGHEAVGHVERLGKFAGKRFGVKEGDYVALEEYLPCGHCDYCREGDFRLCEETDTLNRPNAIRFGSTPTSIAPALWGGYSQYQYLHPKLGVSQSAFACAPRNSRRWRYRSATASNGPICKAARRLAKAS